MRGRYKAYTEYKDSGVEWLNYIPSHWRIMQLKRSVRSCVNGIWGSEPNNDGADTIVIRVADFERSKLTIKENGFTYRKIEEKEKISRKLISGDLLIEKSGGGDKTLVGQVVLFNKTFEAVTSNFVAKMSPKLSFDSRYLNYVFSRFYSSKINYCSIKQNTGIQNLDSAAYLSERFGFPKEEEQIKIANFLDHETAKIDTLIEKQKQLIKLLKEKRQAVISHTVTKGLNPDVSMKDSGVEWLGEVPEHWISGIKLNSFAERSKGSFVNGPFGSDLLSSELTDEGVPVIYIRDLKQTGYKRKSTVCVTAEKAEQLEVCKVKSGDVLIAKVGDPPGETCVYPKNEPDAIITQDVIRIRVNMIVVNPKYLTMLLNSDFGKLVIDDVSVEATRKRVSLGDLKSTQFIRPPLSEQNEIVFFLSNQIGKIDQLILKVSDAISLITERRTALISAAVTGKIDVRDWKAPKVPQTMEEIVI